MECNPIRRFLQSNLVGQMNREDEPGFMFSDQHLNSLRSAVVRGCIKRNGRKTLVVVDGNLNFENNISLIFCSTLKIEKKSE